jgi:inosose dehydratase
MTGTTRRNFLKAAGAGLAVPIVSRGRLSASKTRPDPNLMREKFRFELGLASYTFRAFGFDETLAMTKRLGLRKISLKSMHLPLESTMDEIKAAAAKVKAVGLDLYAGGVIYMTKEQDVKQAFAYAQAAGMKMIIGVPNHDLLDLAARHARQYDIMLAIHNHGPTDKIYPTPDSVYEKIRALDRHVGLCIDVGHSQRSGIDPSLPAERYIDRLLDVHIKDVSAATADGTTVEIGRGVIDIPKFLRTIIRLNYSGTVSLEYEKDEKDPLPGASESIGYIRGVLAAL